MNSVVTYYGGGRQPVLKCPKRLTSSLDGTAAPLGRSQSPLPGKISDIKAACTSLDACSAPQVQLKHDRKKIEKSKRARPSLTEQLAAIGHGAEQITKDIHRTLGGDGPPPLPSSQGLLLCTFPVTSFCVGNLTCRYPSPIHFYEDRCEFQFHHPFESSTVILMSMYYAHMAAISLKGGRFSFNIPKQLVHFKLDYNPSVHSVVIQFLGQSAIVEILQKVRCLRLKLDKL